ncbi:hypothetical protein QZH41_011074 [Actinostola sp. cb2023]|nr:hypothetical protein QZH41_011074 [Actinostola sp. cb2023]
MLICTCVWAVGLVSSIVPMFGLNYFIDKEDEEDFGFYGRSSVCLPLQLSSDLPAGWEYSVVFFLAINFAAFVFMLVAYIAIFSKVKRSASAVRSTAINRESSLAKKVIFIILTDFLCWMPVIVIGILSLTGNFNDPTKQVYVWIAVFVLPINSSINPFLYTFATVQNRKNPKKKSSSQASNCFCMSNIDDKEKSEPLTAKTDSSKPSERHDDMEVHVRTGKEKGKKELEKVKYNIQLLEELGIKKLNDGVANPFRAVLVDFSRANTLRIYDDGYYAKTDIIQFGRMFKIMLKCCDEFQEYEQEYEQVK